MGNAPHAYAYSNPHDPAPFPHPQGPGGLSYDSQYLSANHADPARAPLFHQTSSYVTDKGIPAQPFAGPRPPPGNAKLGRTAMRILGLALLMALTLIVPMTIIYWYLHDFHHTVIDWSGMTIYSTAPATRLVILGTVSVTVSKALVGPLMAVYAYIAASSWLSASDTDKYVVPGRLPTPLHLATTMSLFQGARLYDIFFAFRNAQNGSGNPRWPHLLRLALFQLVWLMVLTQGIAAVTLWLQIDASTTGMVPTTSNFASLGYTPSNSLFAVSLNQTMCDNAQLSPISYASCGLVSGGSASGARTRPVGYQVYTNSSTFAKVAWLDDNTAVMVPLTEPSIGYQASSLGVRSACQSITDQCVSCQSYEPDADADCAGPQVGPTFNCTGDVAYQISGQNFTIHRATRLNATTGAPASYRNAVRNPMMYWDVVASQAYMTPGVNYGSYFVGNSGFLYHGNSGGVNVLSCQIFVMNVTYRYMPPGNYTSLGWVAADLRVTTIVGSGIDNSFGGGETSPAAITALIDGVGQVEGGESYADAYARLLSKLAISSIAASSMALPADKLLPGVQNGSRVHIVPFLLLLILDWLLVFTALAVGVIAATLIVSRHSPYVRAARGRLLSMYPLMGDSLGGLKFDSIQHTHATEACDDGKSFVPESEQDRLVLFPQDVVSQGQQTMRLRPVRVGGTV